MSFLGDLLQYGRIDTAKKKGGGIQSYKPFFFADTQIIDMADEQVTLILTGTEVNVDGAAKTIILDSNLLAVDANSAGTEKFLLPPEADCKGLALFIMNSGGESILVRNDADGAIQTIATGEVGWVACDGTTWRAFSA